MAVAAGGELLTPHNSSGHRGSGSRGPTSITEDYSRALVTSRCASHATHCRTGYPEVLSPMQICILRTCTRYGDSRAWQQQVVGPNLCSPGAPLQCHEIQFNWISWTGWGTDLQVGILIQQNLSSCHAHLCWKSSLGGQGRAWSMLHQRALFLLMKHFFRLFKSRLRRMAPEVTTSTTKHCPTKKSTTQEGTDNQLGIPSSWPAGCDHNILEFWWDKRHFQLCMM